MRRFAVVLVCFGAGLLLPELASAQDQAQIDRGKAVYADSRCALCHAIAGDGNAKGPLDNVGNTLSEEDIRLWIVDAATMTSRTGAPRKPVMRSYPDLPREDLDALVAYMMSLKQ